jgi:transcriptional regulator with XRE-family HTH domain
MPGIMIFPSQIRAARALIGMSQTALAELSGVGLATIKRIEASGHQPTGNARTLHRLQSALEAEGIRFIEPESGAGPGVRLALP